MAEPTEEEFVNLYKKMHQQMMQLGAEAIKALPELEEFDDALGSPAEIERLIKQNMLKEPPNDLYKD